MENKIQEDEIDLMDLLKVLFKNKILISIVTLIFTILGIVISFKQDKIYQAKMTFVQESGNSGSSALLSSIPFAGLAGLGGSSGKENFKVIMESRTFRENIAKNLNLYDYYIKINEINLEELNDNETPKISDIAFWIGAIVNIEINDKSGVYTVSVELNDSKKIVEISNYYFDELESYLKNTQTSNSKRSRTFIAKQLEIVEAKLKEKEEELKAFEKKYKTISILDEAKILTETLGLLKQKVFEVSSKLEIAKEFTGSQNIEVKKLVKEISVYKEQIEILEKGGKKAPISIIPLNELSDIKINIGKIQREISATGEIYKMLLIQYETSKIEEVKDSSVINILDPAIEPKIPIKPNRKLNVIIAFILGGMFGVFISFTKEFIKNIDWSKLKED